MDEGIKKHWFHWFILWKSIRNTVVSRMHRGSVEGGRNMKRSKKFWTKNEIKILTMLGFSPVPGSGNGWVHKEDGESEHAISQLKSTEADSIKLNYFDIQKLEYHAQVSHKIPVFLLQFLERGTYIAVNVDDFENLKHLLLGEVEKIVTNTIVINHVQDEADKKTIKSTAKARQSFYDEKEKKYGRKNENSFKRR